MQRRIKLFIAGRLERRVQHLLRRRPQLKVVAVGGSVGKTSTKLAIAAMLCHKYRVQHHEGNYNDPISVPLFILGIEVPEQLNNPLVWLKIFIQASRRARADFPYDIILAELGTDQPGDLPHFMQYLRPDIGVVTATTPEHMLNFKTEAAVIKEELALARGSKLAIINGDDEGIRQHLGEFKSALTYGQTGAIHFTDRKRTKAGTIFGQLCLGQDTVKVETKVIAEHSLYAIQAAAAVAQALGLSKAEISAGIADFKPVAGRMNLLPGVNGSLVIDDSYNSSPDAALAALEALDQLADGRSIAILGSMNELGSYAKTGHERVGAACGNLDLLVTIGRDAKDLLAPAAQKAGLAENQIKTFVSPYQAGHYLKPLLRPGDVILVKGSQNGVFSEEAAAIILRNPADRSKLVRQSPEWLKKKQAQFND